MNVDSLIERVSNCEYLSEREMRQVCNLMFELVIEESNVEPIQPPVAVCGDIHGQFFDFKELLRVGGMPPATSYVFLVRQRSSARA
jgi:hypothetical protein